MTELLVLSLANNRRPLSLPAAMDKLRKLRKLYLRGSDCSLPLNVSAIQSLVEVDVSPNIALSMDPELRMSLPLQINVVH